MKIYIITFDLGTTDIKFNLFDSRLSEILEIPLTYNLKAKDEFVEFDTVEYWEL